MPSGTIIFELNLTSSRNPGRERVCAWGGQKILKKLNNILVDQRRYVNRVSIHHTHFTRISAVKTIKIALVHVILTPPVLWFQWSFLLLRKVTQKRYCSPVCAGFKASAASSISWQSCEHDSRTMKTRSGSVKKLRAKVVVIPWLTRFCIPIPRVHQQVRDVPVKSVSGTGRPSSARPETSWCEPSPRSIATWVRLDEGCRGWSSAGQWTLRSFRKEWGIITLVFGTNPYYGKFTVNPDHPWYLGLKFMILDLRYITHYYFLSQFLWLLYYITYSRVMSDRGIGQFFENTNSDIIPGFNWVKSTHLRISSFNHLAAPAPPVIYELCCW